MRVLFLLRHGKSAWDDPALPDHDRPLAPRGVRAARVIGARLAQRVPLPELILCSSARRAVETLDLVRAELPGPIAVEVERGLYLCGSRVLVARVRDLPDTVSAAMTVGHNPDFHDTACLLAGAGEPEVRAQMTEKFPTAACAILRFSIDRWAEVAPDGGELIAFEMPRPRHRKA